MRRSLKGLIWISAQLSQAAGRLLPSNHPEYDQALLRDNGLVDLYQAHVPLFSAAQGPPWKKQKLAAGDTNDSSSPPDPANAPIPLIITNNCPDDIWPGILTQAGIGPGTGGFYLQANASLLLWVGSTWQGRVWGRTNCTTSGNTCSCSTGDCFAQLSCQFAGKVPATLLEFNLAGGVNNAQAFYDISLVDGYNLPVAIRYIPAANTTFIPPNLCNAACIASPEFVWDPAKSGTVYSNITYPIPWEWKQSSEGVRNMCPWSLLEYPPYRPGDGVYPYPDDNIQHPDFSPCLSECAKTGGDEVCCTGEYNNPKVCRPSFYSMNAKSVCPDAYTYAFDDQSSTFILPKGGGFECIFCPEGRSTNILQVLGALLLELASSGQLSPASYNLVRNATYVDTYQGSAAAGPLRSRGSISNTVMSVTAAIFVVLFVSYSSF